MLNIQARAKQARVERKHAVAREAAALTLQRWARQCAGRARAFKALRLEFDQLWSQYTLSLKTKATVNQPDLLTDELCPRVLLER